MGFVFDKEIRCNLVRACSSEVEHPVEAGKVRGAIPLVPTFQLPPLRISELKRFGIYIPINAHEYWTRKQKSWYYENLGPFDFGRL